MICNFENIKNIIKEEGLDLIVVSYGGSCSNQLANTLEKNGYKIYTNIYKKILCHCPVYIETDIPIIYIYDNPIKSFLSMKNRNSGIWDMNQQKMTNNYNVELSDENLLKCMINQFYTWTRKKYHNVLVVKSSEIFQDNIVNKLEIFLKKKLDYFPIDYIKPNTNIDNINDEKLVELFKKFEKYINEINEYKPEE
jgi:hypothetical protein